MLTQYLQPEWATVLHHPLVYGAISGVLAAAKGDYHAFQTFKNFHDFADYSWSTALWRWVQGAVIGVGTAAGLGAL